MPAPILGIDFGTTNTAAAYFEPTGKLKVVAVKEKSCLLPSVAWFHAPARALVGHAARTQIVDDPAHTVFGIKRFLGRRFNSEFVSKNKGRFAFEIVAGEDGYSAVSMYGQIHTLAHCAELIIRQIVTLANHGSPEPFQECVLTVPAHASIRQREAVRQSAEAAGLLVRAMINEPTAAALYYANLRNPEQTVMVFDLGGGTLDVTLLKVQNKVVKVLGTGGDAFLGGANFDERIVEVLVDEFERKEGISLRDNKTVMQRLAFAAEVAKINLSTAQKTLLRVPCIATKDGKFIHFEYEITRAMLEEMVLQLVEKAAGTLQDVLDAAGMTSKDIDDLVLVGGQTRMPAIRARLAHFRHATSDKDVHPDLGVAIGAAILGRNLRRSSSTGLLDVLPMPLSVMGPGIGSVEVLEANLPLPAKKSISLDKLPPGEVSLMLFEAADKTSIEREMLQSLAIPLSWRTSHPGPLSLEVSVGQDFVVRAAVVPAKGEPLKLGKPV